MAEIRYDQVQVGMVVVCKKQEMEVTEVQEKLALGKKGEMGIMRIKLIGKNVETGKVVKEAFRPEDRKIECLNVDDFDIEEGSDEESEEEVEEKKDVEEKTAANTEFDDTESGASLTAPIRAGEVKKGSFVMLKEHPCKVIDVSTSKTGKHGHAKAKITGIDVFNGNKYMDVCPTSHNMTAPIVTRLEFIVADVSDDGKLCLTNEDGLQKEDLDLPKTTTNEFTEVSQGILREWAAIDQSVKQLTVVVLGAMAHEQVVDYMLKNAAE